MKISRRHIRAKPTFVDGIRFASKGEARRYSELRVLQDSWHISDLKTHPRLSLVVNGRKIGRGYITLDFLYLEAGEWIYEDYKAIDTRESKLRRQLAEAIHGISIRVTS